MKFKTTILTAAFAALTAMSACSSIGNEYDVAAIDQLKPGETTISEAITLLGEPVMRTKQVDGTTLLQWQHTNVVYTSARGTHHAVIFGKDKKMIEIMTQSSTNVN